MYDTFMSTLTHEMKDALNDLLSNVAQDCGTQKQFLKTSLIFQQHMVEFDVYLKKAMDGDLGSTVQYWSMYVHMVNRLHRDLSRAIRTNYVNGYIQLLPAMIDIFLDQIDQTMRVGVSYFSTS